MIIRKPPYFDSFRCIADRCPDSCCKEWSVSVDPVSAEYYRRLPGALGDRLRQVLAQEDGNTVMVIQDGRCPMWREDGLCRIQAELGHDALCKTCRDFPRLTHDYGNFRELGLELSCPEAARMILSSPICPPTTAEISIEEEAEYDPLDMDILLKTREEMRGILTMDKPVNEILAISLLYGYHAQNALDSGALAPFDPEEALEGAKDFAKPGDPKEIIAFFKELEILTVQWKHRLEAMDDSPWQPSHLRLMAYFVERYWLQAISDLDIVGRAKLGIIACLTVKLLGGDLVETAQLFSKEIENDPDNVEAILDGAYSAPAFTDEKLLGSLLL